MKLVVLDAVPMNQQSSMLNRLIDLIKSIVSMSLRIMSTTPIAVLFVNHFCCSHTLKQI